MNKKVIIIGAGVGGLSCGCYAQMNGYETEIFEMHNLPGGNCTSWKRKEYIIDGCIDFLAGSNKSSPFYKIWEEIGAIQDKKIVNHKEFIQVEDGQGNSLKFYNDIDKLEQEFIKVSPEDTKLIKKFCNYAKQIAKFKLPVHKSPQLFNIFDTIKLLISLIPVLFVFKKSTSISIEEFASQFKSALIRQALTTTIINPQYILYSLLFTMGIFDSGDGGYPIGGSLEFAKSIEKKYKELGGRIYYKSKVKEILVKNDNAVGIKLTDGTENYGDIIISACDGYSTIFNMLKGKYINDKIKNDYTELPLYSSVQVSLGIDSDLTQECYNISLKLEEPINVGGIKQNFIFFRNYCFDKTLAPKGKSVLISKIFSEYDFWEKIYSNKEKYNKEKKKIADFVIKEAEKRFPYIKEKIEVIDVATPITYNRYTGVRKGSYMGWFLTKETGMLRFSNKLPNLDDFYLIGQWTQSAGSLTSSAMSGKHVVQELCCRDKKEFKS